MDDLATDRAREKEPRRGAPGRQARDGEACVLAGLAMGLVLLLGGCGAGDGNISSTRSGSGPFRGHPCGPAGLIDLIGRWDLLAERAPDDYRRNRSGQIRSLLQELVAAVDAENEALAAGRDWRLLRPRVDEAGRTLSAALAGIPRPEPPAGGEPGPESPV